MERIAATVDALGAPRSIEFLLTDINLHQKHYPNELLDILRSQEKVFGVVYKDGQVGVTGTQSHSVLMQAVNNTVGVCNPVGRFQIENRGLANTRRFSNGPFRFDFIFVSLNDLNLIKPVGNFLGIDRDWQNKAHCRILRKYNNYVSGDYRKEIDVVDRKSWRDIFCAFTNVVLSHGSEVLLNGYLCSVSLNKVVDNANLHKDKNLDLAQFALAYDPIAKKIASGDGHEKAAGNLGYSNDRVIILENWSEEFLKKIPAHKSPTIEVRYKLQLRYVGDLVSLAKSLKDQGFNDQIFIFCNVFNGLNEVGIVRSRIGTLVNPKFKFGFK